MKYMMGGAAVTKTGLNNASGIVWAISEFFLLFSSFFGILTNVYSIYIVICDGHNGKGDSYKNGPE